MDPAEHCGRARTGFVAAAAVLLALLGWRLRPTGSSANPAPDIDVVRACAVLAWLVAGYVTVVVAAVAAARLLGVPSVRLRWLGRTLPPALRRLAGLTAAVSAAGAVMSSGTGLMAAATAAPVSAPPAPDHRLPPLDWPTGSARSAADAITVRPGDTLWAIAGMALPPHPSDHAVAVTWPRWWAANRRVIGPDPNLIRPGQRLRPPAAEHRE